MQHATMNKQAGEGHAVGAHLLLEKRGHVAILTMNRPEKLNAMARNFWPDLRDAFARMESDPDIRAVIITGAGDRAFSAGGDIASFRDLKTLLDKRAFQLDAMKSFAVAERPYTNDAIDLAHLLLVAAADGATRWPKGKAYRVAAVQLAAQLR